MIITLVTGDELAGRVAVFEALHKERIRQDEQHGQEQFRHLSPWRILGVLTEELGEVARAIAEGDSGQIHEELIHLGASCVAWLESLNLTPEGADRP
jgi:NTP pyrophosphatase (non-canonical NTP hydrolase)